MFKSYFRITWRNLWKNKTFSFINLTGLAVGMACVLLIYLWVNDELSIDKFHKNDSRLFQVMENRVNADGILTSETTSGPMAKALKGDMPEVDLVASVYSSGEHIFSAEEHDIKANGLYAGEDFFKMFSYPLLQGNRDHILKGRSEIVISKSLARRLFDTGENMIGKMVKFDHTKQLMVSGVFEDIPRQSSERFDFVLSFDEFTEGQEWAKSWGNTWTRTFLMLKEGADAALFNTKITDYIKVKNNYNREEMHRTAFIARYTDRYLYGKYENGKLVGGRIDYVRLFSIIAIFILVIACINFMNLSTAKASKRMKEVGIKKAMGVNRSALVFQYLSESVMMAMFALLIAVAIVSILLPQFNQITGKQLALVADPYFIPAFLAIALCTGLIAGTYPAFYLSGFSPINVLKGKLSNSIGELWTRKGLVVFQFALSIILIVSVLVVYRQIEFIQNKNLGYTKENVIYFSREGKAAEQGNLATFVSELKKIPGIVNASSTVHNMQGHNSGTSGIQWPGRDPNDQTEFEHVTANYDLIETLGVEMKEGRTFSRNFGSDTSAIIFNEAAIAFMGLDNPIGKTVDLWDRKMQIIGVVKNFNFESLHEKVKPLFFRLAPEETYLFMARVKTGMEKETIDRLRQLYQTFNPGFPFDYRFLDEEYQALYTSEQRVATLSGYFAGIAILISCLGLFGLAAFTAERRQKEIGIRKVLGASVNGVIALLSKDFIRLVVIAIVIAVPIAWYVMDKWLQNFAYHIGITWWMFALAGLLAVAIALLAVGAQSVKAALMNPVKSLRSE
ncbi:ABC transporter permease [Olivibacter jilunii]|uniref:ABC transporter permease n=1 Tax=Olivibacter jilunii TaxID=985016 RepID=UPI003F155E00